MRIAHLLVRAPKDRQHGGRLAAFRIFPDLGLGPGKVLRREGEALRLLCGEAADTHWVRFFFPASVVGPADARLS